MSERCETCRFFGMDAAGVHRACRRRAPPWSQVQASDWCGEWQETDEVFAERLRDRAERSMEYLGWKPLSFAVEDDLSGVAGRS